MSTIITPQGKYIRYECKNEPEFEKLVKEHIQEMLGKDVLFFDVKTEIRRVLPGLSVGAIPDGFALDLRDPNAPRLFIIEYERKIHDIYSHVTNQILRFKRSFQGSKEKIYHVLESRCATDSERVKLQKAIWDFEPLNLVIIDEATEDLKREAEELRAIVLEFRTYINDAIRTLSTDHLHMFETFGEEVETQGRYAQFFQAIERTLRSKLEGDLATFSTNDNTTNYKQFWYPHQSRFHFEVWIRRGKLIDVGLHLESDRSSNLRVFRYIKSKEKDIKKKLPRIALLESWGQKWCKISEQMPYSEDLRRPSEGFVAKIASLQAAYIEALKSFLDEVTIAKE